MTPIIIAALIGLVVGERISTFVYQRKIEDFAESLLEYIKKAYKEQSPGT